MNADTEHDRICRWPETHAITGLSRGWVWSLERQELFPKRVRLTPGGRACGWRHSELMRWLESRERVGSAA